MRQRGRDDERMPLAQTDLDNLDAAIASGQLTVTVEGKSITYRSIVELERARRHVSSLLASQGGNAQRSVYYFTPALRRD